MELLSRWNARFRIGTRIGLGFGALILIVAALAGAGVWQLSGIDAQVSQMSYLADGTAYVLGDYSAAGLTAAGWAGRVAEAYAHFQADAVVAEANQGGDMVKQVLLDALPNAAVKLVHATRDKRTRATPAAALYEQGRVRHVGAFPELEDQMCSYDGSGKSPDRMDALVWALAHLFPAKRAKPQLRGL